MSNVKKFIEKSINIHGSKYNYDNVIYINNTTLVSIVCLIHGEFKQKPINHLNGCGCQKCARLNQNIKTKLNNDKFIEKAKLIHGDKYNYSEVDYINAKTKIKIICTEHGVFEQSPNRHLSGDGCPKCAGRDKTINDFVNISNKKHNFKYNYEFITQNNIKYDLDVKIVCPIHGEFYQKPSSHIFKYGCPECGGKLKLNNDKFIEKAKLIHGDKYNYSNINYINSNTKIKIICDKHGLFKQTPCNHLQGQGCPICKESKGEKNIRRYLLLNNIEFISEYKFNECYNEKLLPFDFYLPKTNTCIEYDGIQHYKPINRFGGELGFKRGKINDEIKNDFCSKNKIKLIRISYFEDIIKVLNDNKKWVMGK
jgi:hypothetical protein